MVTEALWPDYHEAEAVSKRGSQEKLQSVDNVGSWA